MPTFFPDQLRGGTVTATREAGTGATQGQSGLAGGLPNSGPFTYALPAPAGVTYDTPVGLVDDMSQYRDGCFRQFRHPESSDRSPARQLQLRCVHTPILTGSRFSPPNLPDCVPTIGNPPVKCLVARTGRIS